MESRPQEVEVEVGMEIRGNQAAQGGTWTTMRL